MISWHDEARTSRRRVIGGKVVVVKYIIAMSLLICEGEGKTRIMPKKMGKRLEVK